MSCKVAAALLVGAMTFGGCGPKPDTASEPPRGTVAPTPVAPPTVAAPSVSASAAAAPAAVLGPFQAPAAIPVLERKEVCAKPVCTVDAALLQAGPDGPPARMWEQQIAKGSKLTVPKTKDATAVVVVLDGAIEWDKDARARLTRPSSSPGSASKAAVEPPAPSLPGQPLEGAVIHPMGFSLTAAADARVLLVIIDHPKVSADKPLPPDPRTPIFNLRGATDLAWASGGFGAKILVDPTLARSMASVTLLGIGSPTGVAAHVHENEWEMLAILSGAGTMSLGKGTEAKRVEVRPGSLIAIPKGTLHAFVPTELPVTAIQLYVPPGPEQRFRKLAAPTN
jgi:mannose-6-phosphate isomerase-like protein (cupin superfamily)